MYSGVPRARQVKCAWIHLRVGIQCVLFSVGPYLNVSYAQGCTLELNIFNIIHLEDAQTKIVSYAGDI